MNETYTIESMKIDVINRDELVHALKKDIDKKTIGEHISITNTEAMHIGSSKYLP